MLPDKASSKTLARCALLSLLLSVCLPALGQNASGAHNLRPMKSSGSKSQSPAVSDLNAVVATVEARKITRRDVAVNFLVYDTRAIPKAQNPDYAPTDEELALISRRLFAGDPLDRRYAAPIVQQLMIDAAVEEAAARHGITLTAADLAAGVHNQLDIQRRQAGLEKAPDDKLMAAFKLTPRLLRWSMRRELLIQKLVLWDLNDHLGHAPGPEDFFSAHLVVIIVKPRKDNRDELDWDEALKQSEAYRADILAGKQTLEQVAEKHGEGGSKIGHGDVGPVPRTLLQPPVELAILAAKPGEIPPPIRANKAYVLARLDKRGPDLTAAERQQALAVCMRSQIHRQHVIERVLKDIHWSSAVAQPPEWFRQPVAD